MELDVVYYVSLLVFGGVVGATNLFDIAANGATGASVLGLLAACLVVGGISFQWANEETVETRNSFKWLGIVGACLYCLGALISLA